MFPLTSDDMIRGVTFVDFGTVEEDTRLDWDSFRVAPGVGLRVHMPAAGMGGAPLAFDFAFPINKLGTDDRQIFSFYMGFTR
jgi:outer membrane protein insertion porin family